MKTKQLIAGISAATVLAMVTTAYAGPLGGGVGAAGALGGSMTGGIGRMSGQGAFDGRGAASTSFDRLPERPASRATKTKPAATGASAAHKVDGSAAPAPAATTPKPATKVPSPTAASPSPPPSVTTSATGAGGIEAQHSRGDNSVAVSGEASGSASRTE